MFEQAMNTISYIGQVLIDDDAHDFGWYSYTNRPGHKDHPSPLHHWQYGLVLTVFGEIGKFFSDILNTFQINIKDVFSKMQTFFNRNNNMSNSQNNLNYSQPIKPKMLSYRIMY
jgi:hypothetical protein